MGIVTGATVGNQAVLTPIRFLVSRHNCLEPYRNIAYPTQVLGLMISSPLQSPTKKG